jgi:2-dehydropantoate 2-reductase
MRVAVIGAGAIGAILAAAGAEAGHDVVVCVRTPIDRLVVERDGAEQAVAATIVADATAALAVADVVWVATKSADTAGAAPWLARLCGPGTLVAAAQNGLDQDRRLLPFVPAGTVVPALAYIAAERVAPGRVVHLAGDRVVVPAGAAVDRLGAAVSPGLVVRGVDDIWTAAWRKLFGNLIANPITTLTLRRIGVMSDPGIGDLARGLLREAMAVGRAEGAQLEVGDIEATVTGASRYGDRTGSSMLYDRLAGRPLEHPYLTGEVVRRAATHGIAVPLNAAVLALLDALEQSGAAGTGI